MFYIGYFTFDGEDSDHKPWYGSFECVVDADDTEKAIEEFKRYLLEVREEGDLLDKQKLTIYLNEIIEVRKEMKLATVSHFRECAGEPPPTVHGKLPAKNTKSFVSYQWQPDDLSDEDFKKLNEEGYSPEPFLEFE